ncbi:MAG: DUF4105 domain-containing protein [Trueperaceae bacterium]|nr:DUF4105 domain-containing protein [Trueperaceae bacterium]
MTTKPAKKDKSANKNWKADVARQPTGILEGNCVTLKDVRNTRYPAPGEPYEVVWETRQYQLEQLKRLWFLVEPFHPSIKAIAHTFISFEFEDDFLALSIEARLRQDQSYSIARGFVGAYALTYSFGDEKDFIVRRTQYLEHELYLYPLVTPPMEIRALFLNVLASANALIERPRRYNSVLTNCTSALRKHANQVRPSSFPPFIWADVLPGRSDKVLYQKTWIDTTVPFEKLRETYAIKDKAERFKDEPEFSRLIRQL